MAFEQDVFLADRARAPFFIGYTISAAAAAAGN